MQLLKWIKDNIQAELAFLKTLGVSLVIGLGSWFFGAPEEIALLFFVLSLWLTGEFFINLADI